MREESKRKRLEGLGRETFESRLRAIEDCARLMNERVRDLEVALGKKREKSQSGGFW